MRVRDSVETIRNSEQHKKKISSYLWWASVPTYMFVDFVYTDNLSFLSICCRVLCAVLLWHICIYKEGNGLVEVQAQLNMNDYTAAEYAGESRNCSRCKYIFRKCTSYTEREREVKRKREREKDIQAVRVCNAYTVIEHRHKAVTFHDIMRLLCLDC